MKNQLIVDPRRYKVTERKLDAWARRWLKDKNLKWPEKFIDVNEFEEQDEKRLPKLHRGAGIEYEVFNENLGQLVKVRGVIVKRRAQLITVKNEKQIIDRILIFASRHDWSVYSREVAKRNLRRLENFIDAHPKVKEVLGFCKARRSPSITASDFNRLVYDEINWKKLNDEEHKLVTKYLEILDVAEPIYYKSYDGT